MTFQLNQKNKNDEMYLMMSFLFASEDLAETIFIISGQLLKHNFLP